MLKHDEVMHKVRAALLNVVEGRPDIRPEHHLVDDLGLDSVHMASLTIALEDEFDEVLLLNDWIASANSPSDLTVSSLVDYLLGIFAEIG